MPRDVPMSEEQLRDVADALARKEYLCPWCDHRAAPRDLPAVTLHGFTNFLCTHLIHAFVVCGRCSKAALLDVGSHSHGSDVMVFKVLHPARRPPLLASVPKPVAEHFAEAELCLDAGAFSAALLLARRALRHAASIRVANDDAPLAETLRRLIPSELSDEFGATIDELAATDADLAETAVDVTPGKAERIIASARKLLQAMFA